MLILSAGALESFLYRSVHASSVGDGGGGGGGGGGGSGGGGIHRPARYFPGKGTVLQANYVSYLEPILIVVEQERAHIGIASSTANSAKWKNVHKRLFDSATGVLRYFKPWTADGWKKLKATILGGILEGGDALWHQEDSRGNTHKARWMELAHALQEERLEATEDYQRNLNERQVETAERRARLGAATQELGLSGQPPGQSAPSLPSELTSQQRAGLATLGGLSASPNRDPGAGGSSGVAGAGGGAGAAATSASGGGAGAAATSASGGGAGAAATSASGGGAGAAATSASGGGAGAAATSASGRRVGSGANAQFRATAAQQRQQALTAVGPSHSPPVLNGPSPRRQHHRARNPDQIDVLDHMNKYLSNGIESLNKVIAQTGPGKIEKLRAAINHRRNGIIEKERNGLSAQEDKDMLKKLEDKLNEEEMNDLLN